LDDELLRPNFSAPRARAQTPGTLLLRKPAVSRTQIAVSYGGDLWLVERGGGEVTAPRWGLFNPDTGELDVENRDVAPDIEVELDPALWRQGHDPQLEKGIATALAALKEHPPVPVKRPKYPVYDWSKVRRGEASK